MDAIRWKLTLSALLILALGTPAMAQTTDIEKFTPSGGRLVPEETLSDKAVEGTFYWEKTAVGYRGELSEDGTTATATVTDAWGQVLAEAVITPDGGTVVVAGVKITGNEEDITDEGAAVVAKFAETPEAAAIRGLASDLAGSTFVRDRGKLMGLIGIALVLGDGAGVPAALRVGNCFGCCGPGCWGCYLLGNCYTTACAVHDGCVALFGHTNKKCLALLVVATASYIKECL